MGLGEMGLKSNTSVLCFCVLLALGSVAFGKTIYVDDDANGANNGTSWIDAYNYLQDALADANASEKPIEIHVVQGTYKPDQGTGIVAGDRKEFFQLTSGVTLKGGYAGIVAPDPNVRDVEIYQTILSGDLNGNDLSEDLNFESPNDVWQSYEDNSECVIDGSYTDRTAVIDGFLITGGYHVPSAAPDRGDGALPLTSGGGMRIISGSPMVVNCTFKGNRGGIENYSGSSPSFIDCRFAYNVAGEGGAMINVESYPEILRSAFENNSAWDGGAISIRGGSALITICKFSYNQARDTGGAVCNDKGHLRLVDCEFYQNESRRNEIYGSGGALFISDDTNTVIERCTFRLNGTNSSGGAVCISGNAVATLEDCVFHENKASSGGGYSYNGQGDMSLFRCIFQSNFADNSGGGISLNVRGTASINDCIFKSNRALRGGGIFSLADSLATERCMLIGNRSLEGASAVEGSVLQLLNCTLANNLADEGYSVAGANVLTVRDSIIWDPNPFKVWPYTDIMVAFSNIRDGWFGEGNNDLDPCFADPGYWDPNGTPDDPNDDFWVNGDYHLKSKAGRWDTNTQSWIRDDVTSPCIDVGDPMSPIGLEPFPNGGRINMGAYGGTAEASKSYFGGPVCETIVAGDINGDCQIDWADFMIMVFHWMEDKTSVNSNSVAEANKSYFDEPICETVIAGDINSDCKVDFRDFSLAAAHWLGDYREKVHIKWLGHASVKIWTSTVVIYIDPYRLTTSPKDATLLLITHSHSDHYSPADITRVSGPATQLIAPLDVVTAAGKGTVILPGQTIDLGSVRITAVAAYNSNHPKSKNWVGFIVEVLGKRIFCAGDTSLTTELKAVVDMDIAFLPIDGVYNMGPATAAEATVYMQPKLAVPYHWNTADPQTFAKLAACPVKIMTVGEEITF